RLFRSADVHQGTRVVAAGDPGAEDRLMDELAHVAVPLAHPLLLDGQRHLEGGEQLALADPLGDDVVDPTLCGDAERHGVVPLLIEYGCRWSEFFVGIESIPPELPSVAGRVECSIYQSGNQTRQERLNRNYR